MIPVTATPLPKNALLMAYQDQGAYTDCYAVALPTTVSHAHFVEAFYTTWLFKLERLLIALLAFRPSSDRDAACLATGQRDVFAAWKVEQRNENEVLLADNSGLTRSWLMSEQSPDTGVTQLYFGSALVPRRRSESGEAIFGPLFRPLLRFHDAYSVALLRSAANKLLRSHQLIKAAD